MMKTTFGVQILICLFCFAISTERHDNKIDPTKIYLIFYDCDTRIDTSVDRMYHTIECTIQDTDCIESAYNFIKRNKNETTVYIPGYNATQYKIPAPDIVSAYCSRNFSIISILDWSEFGRGEPSLVINQTSTIGKIIANTFNFLNDNGYEMAKWHLVGHSLGAHLASCVATYTNFSFLHITGLDPAKTLMHTNTSGCLFNPEIAHFTDAFYTDRGGWSTEENIGRLNVYANIGMAPQSGCLSSTDIHKCGHINAGKWYADAVRNETKYLATKCLDCFMFQEYNYCKNNDRIYFNPHIDANKTGLYCLPID